MTIDFSRQFEKSLKKAPHKVRIAFRDRFELFVKDKFHPLLHNHSLIGKFKGSRSINVTGDWRAVFREFDSGERIYFDMIGTHSQLYR